MKYWIIGILTIILGIGLLALLVLNIEVFAIVCFSLLSIMGAYPIGKKVVEFYNDVKNEL